MKVLIVSDERYAALDALWEQSQGVGLGERPNNKLPGAAELHAIARDKTQAPEPFNRLTEEMEAAQTTLDVKRAQLQDLILKAYALGIRPADLRRWSGYSASRIFQITNP